MTINHLPQTPASIAVDLRRHRADTLRDLQSILHHPRSLARPQASWRPPGKQLPDGLTMTLTRHRVSERVKARVLGFGEEREPAYLITVRITDQHGAVDPVRAEGWVRALVENSLVDAVHEVPSGRAATFVWLVDAAFHPVHSPASLFAGFSAAA
ncbi:hypothetical protein SAMN06295981_2499 [Corynebacterium pollutisoli]|mgnify:FL=1|uniref:Uncharacterized protein n=1 Tax=Corynebacterium pollutisoli TaxID=1610489 RepID=A0A1X7KGA8_9CORY|nr:hypothetical protein [Corynebacterium pollutisoli]NLP40195.1 hypothetical protein [Corynebacterium pollutisoli]SMG39547.1 hypothetical protein SAMN06295981_2499 [Corynebacterium pollutisoli]HJD77576.1 hypothetical protein [Corynebacterium pollutisoli]